MSNYASADRSAAGMRARLEREARERDRLADARDRFERERREPSRAKRSERPSGRVAGDRSRIFHAVDRETGQPFVYVVPKRHDGGHEDGMRWQGRAVLGNRARVEGTTYASDFPRPDGILFRPTNPTRDPKRVKGSGGFRGGNGKYTNVVTAAELDMIARNARRRAKRKQ